MAQIHLIRGQGNNENLGQHEFTSNKNIKTIQNFSNSKKSVLAEVKNVFHNQLFATPIKRVGRRDYGANVLRLQSSPFKHPGGNRQEFIFPQYRDKASVLQSLSPMKRQTTCKEVAALDHFDLPRECCAKPFKSDAEIWSEMNLIDDTHLNDIIQRSTWNAIDDDSDHERYMGIDVDKVLGDDSGDFTSELPNLMNTLNSASCDSLNDSDDDILPVPQPMLMEEFDLGGFTF